MPRDGSGNYTLPYPAVVDGTTIESAVHNGTMSDIATQLNGPVPIIAGGTGASDATTALNNLGAEKAKQQITNYDSHVWMAGSFWSNAGATSEPVAGDYFNGIAVLHADPAYLTLEAWSITTGKQYVRQKNASVWGAWKEQPGSVADTDARYVNVTGDTMTGALAISSTTASSSPTTGALTVAGGAGVGGNLHVGIDANFADGRGPRWSGATAILGTGASGYLDLFSSAALIGRFYPGGLNIYPTTASTSPVTGALTVAGGVGIGGALITNDIVQSAGRHITTAKQNNFGSPGGANSATAVTQVDANILMYDGSAGNWCGFGTDNNGDFWLRAGLTGSLVPAFRVRTDQTVMVQSTNASNSTVTGALVVGGGIGLGGALFGTSALFNNGVTAYSSGGYQLTLTYPSVRAWGIGVDGAGTLGIDDATAATRRLSLTTSGSLTVAGTFACNGYLSRAGLPGGFGITYFNLNWNGSTAFHLWADATNLGNIAISSDYRIKKDVIDLPGMWDTVKALRPIKYTQAQFTPPSQIEYKVKEAAEQRRLAEESGKTYEAKPAEEIQPMFPADDIERWGFIAHELQESLLPTAADGVKDAPDTIQSINLAPVVAALTKALQEAMTRIEALEAR